MADNHAASPLTKFSHSSDEHNILCSDADLGNLAEQNLCVNSADLDSHVRCCPEVCYFVLFSIMQAGLIQHAHDDLVTDVSYDFYGLRLATCSLDQR